MCRSASTSCSSTATPTPSGPTCRTTGRARRSANRRWRPWPTPFSTPPACGCAGCRSATLACWRLYGRPASEMWARIGVMFVAAAWSLATSAQQPAAPFSSGTDLVVVPVVVEDRKGVPIRTLRQQDFTVVEDGRQVAIETFVAPAPDSEGGMGADGRFIVLALDNINTPAEIAWRVKDIANFFVDRM